MELNDFPRQLEIRLQTAINKAFSTQELSSLAEEIIKDIKLRTKLGKGVMADGGAVVKLKPLSESYKKQRKKLKQSGELSPDTTPSKSNLTKTGEMLDSLVFKIQDQTITIKPADTWNGNKIAWNEEMGRYFFYISKPQYQKIKNKLEDIVEEEIKKQLK